MTIEARQGDMIVDFEDGGRGHEPRQARGLPRKHEDMDSSPEPQKECSPADTPILGYGDPFQTCKLWKCKLINWCCKCVKICSGSSRKLM